MTATITSNFEETLINAVQEFRAELRGGNFEDLFRQEGNVRLYAVALTGSPQAGDDLVEMLFIERDAAEIAAGAVSDDSRWFAEDTLLGAQEDTNRRVARMVR